MQPDIQVTEFDTFIGQAWDEHATDAAGVSERLATTGLGLVHSAPQAASLAQLAHHLYGEHLAKWRSGLAFLARVAALPACAGSPLESVQRWAASLTLCEGSADPRATLSTQEKVRVSALAACNLAEHDAARAAALLQEALAMAGAEEAQTWPAADPAHRALAVAGNGIAVTLEGKPGRSTEERALMILAAQTARRYWALAGTWLETERAEYRLAMTWLQAGDLVAAQLHAQQCLDTVQAHGNVALELFFAWEALGSVARAAGDTVAHQQTLVQARVAFTRLETSDQSWCQASLDKLAA